MDPTASFDLPEGWKPSPAALRGEPTDLAFEYDGAQARGRLFLRQVPASEAMPFDAALVETEIRRSLPPASALIEVVSGVWNGRRGIAAVLRHQRDGTSTFSATAFLEEPGPLVPLLSLVVESSATRDESADGDLPNGALGVLRAALDDLLTTFHFS